MPHLPNEDITDKKEYFIELKAGPFTKEEYEKRMEVISEIAFTINEAYSNYLENEYRK